MAEQPPRIRTMGFCNRPGSPVLKSVHNRLQEMYTENGKIHRIIPKSQAICLLAHIDSPNCIWFKMINHITEQMKLHKSVSYLEPLDIEIELKPFVYVMAPIEEGVYSRARILHIQPVRYKQERFSFVFAHFIDEGYGTWMLEECLAKIDAQFHWHPWQAFPVALFKFDLPKNHSSFERLKYWPEEINEELIRIMGEYEHFKIVPVQGKLTNDYSEYTRAEIYGLSSEKDNEKEGGSAESISHRLASEFQPLELFDRNMFHINQQPIAKREGIKPLSAKDGILLLQQMPKWRRTFPEDFLIKNEEVENENGEGIREEPLPPHWLMIDGELPLVENFTLNLLKAHYSTSDGKQVVFIDWNSLKSPYEFYAFPLKQTQNDTNNNNGQIEKNQIRRFYNFQTEIALELNKFYGDPINRRQIDPQQVFSNLQVGPFFGIFETNEENRGRNFRRIQILAMRRKKEQQWTTEFCRIRYLDIGGTEIVPICCVLRIHTKHCTIPPLCIQLCLQSIQPVKNNNNWNLDEIRFFKNQIRVDIPTTCKLCLINPPNAVTEYNSLPQSWPGVYGIYQFNIANNIQLEAQMVNYGKAIYSAKHNGFL